MRFVDTSYFLALLNPSDQWHQQAMRRYKERDQSLITTYWIIAEVGDAFCKGKHRALFVDLLDSLHSRPDMSILPLNEETLKSGINLFRNRPDKDWSLTDCISFCSMTLHGVSEALTADRHFVQAGFRALLLE